MSVYVTHRPGLIYGQRLAADGGLATLNNGVPYVFEFARAIRRGQEFTFTGTNKTRLTFVGPRPLQVYATCIAEARRPAGPIAGGWDLVVRKNGSDIAGQIEFEAAAGPTTVAGSGQMAPGLPPRRIWMSPNDYLEFVVTQYTTSSWVVRSLHAHVWPTGFGRADPQDGDLSFYP